VKEREDNNMKFYKTTDGKIVIGEAIGEEMIRMKEN